MPTLLAKPVSLLLTCALLAVLVSGTASAQAVPIRTHFDGEWAGVLVKVESQGEWGSFEFYEDRGSDFVHVDASSADLRRWAEAVEAMLAEVHRVGRSERVELQAELHNRTRDASNVIVTRTVSSRGSTYTIQAMDEYLVNFIVIDASLTRIRSLLRYARAAAGPAPAPQPVIRASPTGGASRSAPAGRDTPPAGGTLDIGTDTTSTNRTDVNDRVVERPEQSPRVLAPSLAVYPDEARRAGDRARVVVRVLVGPDGLALSTEIVERTLVDRRGREQPVTTLPYGLEESALAAARRTGFSAARDGGQAVRAYARVTINIGLDR